VVNTAYIERVVHNTFYPPATPKPAPRTLAGKAAKGSSGTLAPSATTVDVYNGGNTPHLASQLSQALTSAGYKAGKVGNIATQSSTQVLYGAGAAASAAKIAGYFTGVAASPSSSLAAGHVEVLLGADATSVPATIGAAPSASTSASPTPSPSDSAPNASQSNGQNGGAVTVKANAPYGIPCVY